MSIQDMKDVVQEYFERHPTPSDVQVMGEMLKLTHSHSCPETMSSLTKESYYAMEAVHKGTLAAAPPSLSFIDGRLQEGGSFDSISCEEAHDRVLQDAIFGRPQCSDDGRRWTYVAQQKPPKHRSYFQGGSGTQPHSGDFGELYEGISSVGVFVWDKDLKQILPVALESSFIPACPAFLDASATQLIFHAYLRHQFSSGLCLNRSAVLISAKINSQDPPKILTSPEITCILPTLSKSRKYMAYFEGHGITHIYMMDLVIKVKTQQGWQNLHRIQKAVIGYHQTLKMFPYHCQYSECVYFQTWEEGVQKLKKINLATGKFEEIGGQLGCSYVICNSVGGVTVGVVKAPQFQSFFYMRPGEPMRVIPPKCKEELIVEEIQEPIPGFYLEHKSPHPAFQKERKGLVVMVHGGPHGCSEPFLTFICYMFLRCGYAVLLPNYIGSAGYGQHQVEGLLGNVGHKDADEIIALLEKVLKEKEHIDQSRVHIYGKSYGGFMGAIMSSRYPKHFKSAIIINGVISFVANLWSSDLPEWSSVETLQTEDYHKLTPENYAKMHQLSAISEEMKIPILQLLGGKDRRVPFRQGLLFDAITRKQGNPIKTYVYSQGHHLLDDNLDILIDSAIKIISFIEGIE